MVTITWAASFIRTSEEHLANIQRQEITFPLVSGWHQDFAEFLLLE